MRALALQPQGLVPPPSEPKAEESICAMTIGGEVILVDLDFDVLSGKEPCVVIRWDGSIGVEYARNTEKPDLMGARTGFYYVPPSRPSIIEQSAGCTILGKVIRH